MEGLATSIFPDFLGVVPTLNIDETRIPIGFLPRDIIASLEEQDSLSARSQSVPQSPSARSRADNDDIEFILYTHSQIPTVAVGKHRLQIAFRSSNHLLMAAAFGSVSSRVDVAAERKIIKWTRSLAKSKSRVQSRATRTFFSSRGSLPR